MEDETQMQAGFDTAYRILVRVGFLIGRVRASIADSIRDSAILAAINHRLDMVETFAYESLIQWPVDSRPQLEIISQLDQKLTELHSVVKSDINSATLVQIFSYFDSRFSGDGHNDISDINIGSVDNLNEKINTFSFNKSV